MQTIPESVIIEADFFISYLRDDQLADKVEKLLHIGLKKKTTLLVSSEIYNDLISAYRSRMRYQYHKKFA